MNKAVSGRLRVQKKDVKRSNINDMRVSLSEINSDSVKTLNNCFADGVVDKCNRLGTFKKQLGASWTSKLYGYYPKADRLNFSKVTGKICSVAKKKRSRTGLTDAWCVNSIDSFRERLDTLLNWKMTWTSDHVR